MEAKRAWLNMQRSNQEDCLLSTDEAAALLAIRPQTLEWWRKKNPPVGPPFFKIERAVRYPLRGLQEWLEKRIVRPVCPGLSAPFYRRMRIEELGAKHRGLLKFVEGQVRKRVPYAQIAEAVMKR
jgi:hypothetical protein